jgi:hypothetical protein
MRLFSLDEEALKVQLGRALLSKQSLPGKRVIAPHLLKERLGGKSIRRKFDHG